MIVDVEGVDQEHVAQLAQTAMGLTQILTAAIVTSMSYEVAGGRVTTEEWAKGERALVMYRQCRKHFMEHGYPARFSEMKIVVDRIVGAHATTIIGRRGY